MEKGRWTGPRPPDRRRHAARLERLSAHRGVRVWRGVRALGHTRQCWAGSTRLRVAEL